MNILASRFLVNVRPSLCFRVGGSTCVRTACGEEAIQRRPSVGTSCRRAWSRNQALSAGPDSARPIGDDYLMLWELRRGRDRDDYARSARRRQRNLYDTACFMVQSNKTNSARPSSHREVCKQV